MKIVNYTDARNNLKTIMDEAVNDCIPIHITRTGDNQSCVLMSLDYYNSLVETVYLNSSPANAKRLQESIAQIKNGELKHSPKAFPLNAEEDK